MVPSAYPTCVIVGEGHGGHGGGEQLLGGLSHELVEALQVRLGASLETQVVLLQLVNRKASNNRNTVVSNIHHSLANLLTQTSKFLGDLTIK